MSGMDMSDDAMSMSEAQMPEADASSNASYKDSLRDISPSADDEETGEAITQPTEPCSHCMMHSQTNSNNSLRVAVDNGSFCQIVAADVQPLVLTSPQTATSIDVHDHGPPGLTAPVYVLVSSFRI